MKEAEHDNKWQNEAPEQDALVLDPFSADHAPGLSLIMQMRIYDVLMALYREQNKPRADRLLTLHAEGRILGPLPDYVGPVED